MLSIFGTGNALASILSTALLGGLFGLVYALIGYAATRGRRDFSSVSVTVATRYEVLVEHKHAAAGPGAARDDARCPARRLRRVTDRPRTGRTP